MIIVGHLGQDPEIRYMSDGTAVTNFSVATSEGWKDRQTGEKKERTEWHRIVAWRQLGEICGKYLSKGRQVYVEGRLVVDPETGAPKIWTGQDGQARVSLEINADSVMFLGGNGGSNGQSEPAPAVEADTIPF